MFVGVSQTLSSGVSPTSIVREVEVVHFASDIWYRSEEVDTTSSPSFAELLVPSSIVISGKVSPGWISEETLIVTEEIVPAKLLIVIAAINAAVKILLQTQCLRRFIKIPHFILITDDKT